MCTRGGRAPPTPRAGRALLRLTSGASWMRGKGFVRACGVICVALPPAPPAGRGGEPDLPFRRGRKLWLPFTTALVVLELATLLGPASSSSIKPSDVDDAARAWASPSFPSVMDHPMERSLECTFLTDGVKIPNFLGFLRFASSQT